MPSTEPVSGRDYPLVRVTDGGIACALYRRFGDGSVLYCANEVYAKAIGMGEEFHASGFVGKADGSASAWKPVWDELMDFGFVELSEARRTGIVPPDWEPPERFLALPPKTTAILVISGLSQPPSVKELAALRRMFPVLADSAVSELRDRLTTSSCWAMSGLAKEACGALQAQGRKLGLHIEIVEEWPGSVPSLYPVY